MINQEQFFREATLKICGHLEVEKAVWQCFLYLRRFIPMDNVSFHIYDAEAEVFETVAYANPSSSVALSIKSAFQPESGPIPDEDTVSTVRILERMSSDAAGKLIARHVRVTDCPGMLMELILEHELIGILAVTNEAGEIYQEEHAGLLGLLNEPFSTALLNILRFRELQQLKDRLADDNRFLQDELRRLIGGEIVGAESGLRATTELVRQVAPIDSPVLLLGETGTGKEVIANAIHNLSPRRNGPFIKVNCGAIPATLMDSELFGHEKGAFTGAVSQKRGRFERAHRGTIFLDEIGELSLEAQVRLLRVLQDKEIERVGGTNSIKVDIRVLAATHRDLEKMQAEGAFREDLFFRLKVFPINIPPLRNRLRDIPALVDHFIDKKTAEMKLSFRPPLAMGALDILRNYHWPGNIRELENAVERAIILNPEGPLTFNDLEASISLAAAWPPRQAETETYALDEVMARHIQRILKMTDGRIEGKQGAAELLGLNPGTLRHRMRKLGIPFGRASNNA